MSAKKGHGTEHCATWRKCRRREWSDARSVGRDGTGGEGIGRYARTGDGWGEDADYRERKKFIITLQTNKIYCLWRIICSWAATAKELCGQPVVWSTVLGVSCSHLVWLREIQFVHTTEKASSLPQSQMSISTLLWKCIHLFHILAEKCLWMSL